MLTYLEHIYRRVNGIVTHLHDSPFDCIAMGYLDILRRVTRIHHKLAEFRFINGVEWLIGGHDPLCQQIFELVLVPRGL